MEKWLEGRIGGDVREERTRSAYGKAASLTGIACNAALFGFKLAAGLVSGSMAITADAVNNLFDASSSVISLLGFKLADKPADAEHPYGHGRYEYLSGLLVAMMILLIGWELLKSSIGRILSPEPVAVSAASVLVLVGSIAAKLWLARFNRRIGRKIGSKTLEATAQDSRNDVIATSAVLAGTLLGWATGLQADGWMGAAVAAFILVSGVKLVRETIDPMLGAPASREMIKSVREKIMSYPGVLGTHDLMVHDYGPGRQFASVHVEMSSQQDPMECHDLIDNIERDFLERDGLHLVIHYDPVATDDPRVGVMTAFIAQLAAQIDPDITIHDLRIVPGSTHVNVVFDCVMPYRLSDQMRAVKEQLCAQVTAQYPGYYCVITMEHGFTEA